jgi:hypothetical protein
MVAAARKGRARAGPGYTDARERGRRGGATPVAALQHPGRRAPRIRVGAAGTPLALPGRQGGSIMNVRLIALVTVLAVFVVFSLEAFIEMGFVGFFAAHIANLATIQVFTDLVIALLILSGFLWVDARDRGLPFAPYFVATIFLGSIGPLAYLIHRELASRAEAPSAERSSHARAVQG